jgi:hypothetical protein
MPSNAAVIVSPYSSVYCVYITSKCSTKRTKCKKKAKYNHRNENNTPPTDDKI